MNGSILCRDLPGVDIRRPEDHRAPNARAARKTVCLELLACAARILERMAMASIRACRKSAVAR